MPSSSPGRGAEGWFWYAPEPAPLPEPAPASPVPGTALTAEPALEPAGWVFAHRDGERVQEVQRSFGSACARAVIEDFRVHDLPHTCAAWLVTAGVPLAEVRDLLGHASVVMTERYAHLAPERIRAAVTRLEAAKSHY